MAAIGNCCAGGCPVCCGCTSMAECFNVSVAGVTNADCTGCTRFNTTHTVCTQVDGGCVFITGGGGGFNICTTGGLNEFVVPYFECIGQTGATNPFRLSFFNNNTPGTTYAAYTIASSAWSCLGTNVLVLETTGAQCGGWPASVTMVPI